ncbi:MAG: cupin domain-containing protein [Candidatus Eisenbacteria bacterium]
MNDPMTDSAASLDSTGTDGTTPATSGQSSFAVELGRRIKRLRVDRGLTLKDLEARGGISATHVSEIERGKASPTVGALGRIAVALGVKPSQLVTTPELPALHVVRAAERESLELRRGALTVAPLAGAIHGSRLGVHRLTLSPGTGTALEHRHEGEEWLTVLAGTVEVRFDADTYALEAGDSLQFRAHRPHAYVNTGRTTALVISATLPRVAF